jgi:hypothetical protein
MVPDAGEEEEESEASEQRAGSDVVIDIPTRTTFRQKQFSGALSSTINEERREFDEIADSYVSTPKLYQTSN